MPEPNQERLKDKFKGTPKWSEDFPLQNKEDSSVSRRDFIRYLALVSFGFFAGTLGVCGKTIFKNMGHAKPFRKRIIAKDDIKIGESYVFAVEGYEEPAILVRLDEDRFVAFGQKCTHLQCPVIWKKDEKILFCPCHRGAFNGETGDVLYGPPERALPKLKIEIVSGDVYCVGFERGELA